MAVPYYIGAKAILERLAYKSPKMIQTLIDRDGLPVFKRRRVLKSGGFVTSWAISESAITAWEITMGQRCVNQLRAKRALKLERTKGALAS